MHSLLDRFNIRERRWRDATVTVPRGDIRAAGTWQCDLADGALTWSPEVYALFGIAPGARIDRRAAAEMYVDESRDLMERLRAEAIAERGSFTMEAQIRRSDGALRWMRLTADLACRDGRATHLYGTKRDITHEMLSARAIV
jgi:PAS domain S-box-containing protein